MKHVYTSSQGGAKHDHFRINIRNEPTNDDFLTINWNRFTKNIPFEALTIEETVPELCQLILAEAAPILGIVADFPADFFSPEETLALVPQAVIQAFAEQLNTPLLTAAEQAAAPNLLEAFEEKRQYLAWHLDYYGYVPGKNEYAVESLLTVGNGF